MYVKHLGMLDSVSLISATDRIKTSEKYDYMIDMEVNKILEVKLYLRARIHTIESRTSLKQMKNS